MRACPGNASTASRFLELTRCECERRLGLIEWQVLDRSSDRLNARFLRMADLSGLRRSRFDRHCCPARSRPGSLGRQHGKQSD